MRKIKSPIIIDGHQDIAWNVLTLGRDVLQSVRETRQREERGDPHGFGRCTVGLPEWLAGGVTVVIASIFLDPLLRLPSWQAGAPPEPEDVERAYRRALAQVDVYRQLADRSAQIALIGSRSDLAGVLDSWDGSSPRVGLVLAMEGADPIRRPAEAEEWQRRGVRMVSLSWKTASRYAGGNEEPGPLTDAGRELLAALAETGMVLDLSHLAEESFWEAVDRYEGPLAASHANPRALVPGPRQLSDRMIRAVAERGGVIGVAPYNPFLKRGWRVRDGKEAVTVRDVAAAADHICQVVGDAAHAGLGSDLDGGFGAEATPAEIDTVADLPKIGVALAERGYSDDSVAAIMGTNWRRLLESALPDA